MGYSKGENSYLRLLLKISYKKEGKIPINYNYPLAASIYNLLRLGSPEFASFLHEIGYKEANKTYKLFTFALRFENAFIKGYNFILKSPDARLYISSPMIDTFIQNFIMGTFEKQTIEINDNGFNNVFTIDNVESLPEMQFGSSAKFKLLSPLVLSSKRIINNKPSQYYLRPEDTEEINRVMTKNLINKASIISGTDIKNAVVKLTWDESYLNRHKRVTKKITIKKKSLPPIEIIGIQAPFTLSGNPELIKVGYECGFGEKNSMGFGMADTD